MRSLMGLLDAFQLGEALRLPFLHAGLFLGEPRGEAFGLGLFGECLTLRDSEAAAQLAHERLAAPAASESWHGAVRCPKDLQMPSFYLLLQCRDYNVCR